ncbi:ABC transporter ATP-binding protein [Nocardia terpenica]
MRRIARLFRRYRWRLLIVCALIACSSVTSLVSPFLLRAILDVALPHGRTGLLSLLALGMVGVTIVNSSLSVGQVYLSTLVGQRIMHDLRSAVYARLQRMSLAFFTRTRTGDIQSRIANDIGGMQATVTNTATLLVSSVTTVVAGMAAMLVLDWRLTIAALCLLPVAARVSWRVGGQRKDIIALRQRHLATLTSLVQESLSVSGILLSRAVGRSGELTRRFAEGSATLADLEVRASMAGQWQQSGVSVVLAAMPTAMYWVAGMTATHGRPMVSIGTLVAFTTLQEGLLGPTMSLLQMGVTVRGSTALFERVFEYLDLPVDVPEPRNPVRPGVIRGHVRLEDVAFQYDGSTAALSDISVDIPAGTSLAVVGATGAGKTTLGYLVPRLYDVTAGRVTLDGYDVRELSFDTLSAAIGVVSQETYLLHASVTDNLRFGRPDATREELIAAARAAHIHDLIASLPDGYDTIVAERGYRFSGGERQRLAIARTLLRNPPVLVLDEATSALDTATERAVQEAVDALAAGRTTITIAHRLSTIRDADQIVVLHEGRIVERGTHEHLLARGGRYAALVRKDRRYAATL